MPTANHPRLRCMMLTEQATGSEPFGAALVDGEGRLRLEGSNRGVGRRCHAAPRTHGGDVGSDPTSTQGAHCHVRGSARFGWIVFASSPNQLGSGCASGALASPVNCLPIRDIACL